MTVTSTVTIVTVTITPTTSTSTAYVTVTGKPPQSTSTSYYTVTVTASQSLPTQSGRCPIEEWGQCGGDGYIGKCAGSCGNDSVCKYKDGMSRRNVGRRPCMVHLLILNHDSLVFILQQASCHGSRCCDRLSAIIGRGRDRSWAQNMYAADVRSNLMTTHIYNSIV